MIRNCNVRLVPTGNGSTGDDISNIDRSAIRRGDIAHYSDACRYLCKWSLSCRLRESERRRGRPKAHHRAPILLCAAQDGYLRERSLSCWLYRSERRGGRSQASLLTGATHSQLFRFGFLAPARRPSDAYVRVAGQHAAKLGWRASYYERRERMRTVILLGEVAERTAWLEVVCRECDRRGVLSLVRPVQEHAVSMPMTEVRRVLAGDCERLKAGKFHNPCGCLFPGLARLFGVTVP